MQETVRKAVAEFVGTFALIFIGVLVLVAPGGGKHLIEVALAHGLVIAVMVSATMTISGGQLNPAVTIGLLVGKKVTPMEAGVNIVAQLLGGISGGYLAKTALAGASIVGGVPDMAPGSMLSQGILVEAVLTFFLTFVVYGTAVNPQFGARLGGLAIGLTVALDILAGGPITGAAMNPARWLGAALPAGHFSAYWSVYIIGPILGAIVAGLLWTYVLAEDSVVRVKMTQRVGAKR